MGKRPAFSETHNRSIHRWPKLREGASRVSNGMATHFVSPVFAACLVSMPLFPHFCSSPFIAPRGEDGDAERQKARERERETESKREREREREKRGERKRERRMMKRRRVRFPLDTREASCCLESRLVPSLRVCVSPFRLTLCPSRVDGDTTSDRMRGMPGLGRGTGERYHLGVSRWSSGASVAAFLPLGI